jgi:hypothetical protein
MNDKKPAAGGKQELAYDRQQKRITKNSDKTLPPVEE